MLFWLLILVGGLVAWLGVKKGFYAMFASLFCLMFAVYIGVLAAPKIVRSSEGWQQDPYYAAGCVFGLTLLIFLLLWLVAYTYFLRDGQDYFPGGIERIGGGVCGFLFGYILTSVVLLMMSIMPFSRSDEIPAFFRHDVVVRHAVPPVVKACDFIAGYSLECFYGDSEKAIDFLLSLGDKPQPTRIDPPPVINHERL